MAGPDFSTIFQALAQADKAAAESDPYSPFGDFTDQFGQLLVKQSPNYSLGENALAGFLTGILGGGADYLSQDYRQGQSELAAGQLNNLITGRAFERPEDMSSSVFDSLDNVGTAIKADRLNDAQNEKIEGRRVLMQALVNANSPIQQQRIIQTAKELGYVGDDFDLGGNEARPIVAPRQSSRVIEENGPNLGLPRLSEQEKMRFEENLIAGMPPTQAAASSRAESEDIRRRNKELFGGRLAEEADIIGKTEELIRQGEEGILKAGVTGSAIASTYEKALSFFPGMFPEAEEQAAGDKLLELTRNLGAARNRIVGSGSLSDFESKALFATALSPTNVRSQNEKILDVYKNGLEIMKEHQSFMNYYMSEYGGSPEKAQQLWELYKEANPIIVTNEKGESVVNPRRNPWQRFDFEKAYRGFLSGERPEAQMSESETGIPQVGGMFEGKRVKSVRRVR